ncbi:uncharacterized protein PAC_12079 [Phialocephala subalpina]|uniref:Uncharacterized protein n=1 Tax=Phialocephala subalpina TaxID=576137 RepID=A0A1L7XAY8_9HELO|nr:uncharacterized protein PAC_12079 [Phialocephala subalpina]
MLTAGVPLTPGKDFIYVTPPNSAAVRGGTPCPDSVHNFDLLSIADGLQNISEPLMIPQGESYINQLYTYLLSVNLGTKPVTQAQLNNITALQAKLDVRAQASHQTFGSWVTQHDPLLIAYRRQVEAADTTLQDYEVSVYGPQADTISEQRDKIKYQAHDELASEPGYNMPVYPGVYNVILSPWAPHTQTDGILYKPLYSLTGGFQEACDAWFNGTSGGTTTYQWSMKNVNGKDWSSFGHSTTVSQIGGSIFSLISANKGGSSDTTVFNGWSSKFTEQISLELTMKGAPLVFNVGTGYWDVPSARSTYPTLPPGKSNPLASRARLRKLLIGYEVGLKITINDTNTWTNISTFIQDAKSSTGGGFSIFGFHFGAGGSSTTHRNVSTLVTHSDGTSGVIVIPPSPPGLTFLLGALGRAT